MLMHDPVRIGREVQVDGKREGGREVEGEADGRTATVDGETVRGEIATLTSYKYMSEGVCMCT